MEYTAISRNIKMSPRKVRLVADTIRKSDLKKALVMLDSMEKRASGPLKKILDSAISNAVKNFNAVRENLLIKEIRVDGGAVYKRYHFAGRGRTRPYKKRTSHIKVVLEDKVKEVKSV